MYQSVEGHFFGGPKDREVTALQAADLIVKVIKLGRIDWGSLPNEPIKIIEGYYKRRAYDATTNIAYYYWQGWEDGSE